MTRETSTQLDLLSPDDGAEPKCNVIDVDSRPLAFALHVREWMRLLADEWWPMQIDKEGVRLGVDGICGGLPEVNNTVVVWVDGRRLPRLPLSVYGEGAWREGTVDDIGRDDIEVRWPAPIPLSAVTAFSVSTERERARLGAMSKGIRNIGASPRPIEVRAVQHRQQVAARPEADTVYCPPVRWNALRGAAAMALWAVPSIDPWLEVFCESISATTKRENTAAALGAGWLAAPPWLQANHAPAISPLWAATCEVLGAVAYRDEWRPVELLDKIVERAIALGGDEAVLADLRGRTRGLLTDTAKVDFDLAERDPLGLALQLVLLRPLADEYVTWVEALEAMPLAVWWTGAILSGLVTGMRDLDGQYKGSTASRELLAVRTWNLSSGGNLSWPDAYAGKPAWAINGDRVRFLDQGRPWLERKPSRRGDWFRADYTDASTYRLAFELARKLHPSSLRRSLRLSDTELAVSGTGKLSVDKAGRRIKVKGEIAIELNDAVFSDELDIDQFRDWIAVGRVGERLPPVPDSGLSAANADVQAPQRALKSSSEASKQLTRLPGDPPGLSVMGEFITAQEEQSLLRSIDESLWLDDLKRRVQHYGWRYDYRGRSVDSSSYLGPLPDWADTLAQRLVSSGLVNEMPDQVIVNEYVESQGIARHVDCLGCFKGPIVTISLGESWGMQFRDETGERKIERVLERRSAVVLDGEVREKWTHEIPKRKKEGKHVRGRRVSITFRKVIVQGPKLNKSIRRKVS